MRALVMGGSGFVGHAVVRALLSDGHAVSVLNRGNRPLDSVEQLTADRNDAKAVATAVDGKCFDCLVDTNAYTSEQAGIMVSALAGRVKQAAVISSAAVYADGAATPAREIDAIGGGSAWAEYGRGKAEVEEIYRTAGFPACAAFRPPYICGPNNNLDRESWFFRRIWHGRPILLPGSGSAVYQFLHEDDLGTAIATWLARPQDAVTPALAAYNLADPELVTSAELTALLARVAARKVKMHCVGTAAGDRKPREWFPFRDVDCAVDPSQFMNAYDWSPGAPLEQRFAEALRSLKSRGALAEDDWTPLEANLLEKLS